MHPSLVRQSGEASAVIAGCVFLFITGLLIVGLVMCARRMRRPDASRKCHLSYILFACGWLLSGAIVALSNFAHQRTLGTRLGLAVFGILGLSGIVMAILGLSELNREPGKTGQVPALITLVLASAVLAGLGIAAYSTMA